MGIMRFPSGAADIIVAVSSLRMSHGSRETAAYVSVQDAHA
ncbi:hypothetical protein FM104_05595 [Microbacterium esteraromaticum]|uniref:Uncharacterized protein n=1 Tax=Microbacterium esteraromaticum TaxID=57043 RepID=A0A1R4J663_9MICO|nr:hypothetical protein FM104_05595 [Microbacterium esteraromaticum]